LTKNLDNRKIYLPLNKIYEREVPFMSEVLVEVTRGKIVESCHHGNVVVANGAGKIIAYAGDPMMVTYMRSAAKPIQALNVILSGAAKKYDFTQEELAIMCASHYGEDMHREVIRGLLKKLDLPMSALLCGTPLSISAEYQKKQLWEHHHIDQSNSDCSGKHCGFLSVCKTKGYPIENYNSPEHPMQKEILSIMADLCGMKESDFAIGVDGCSVPVHAMPLLNMAIGYARFSSPDQLPECYREPCRILFSAMNAAPEMLAGTGGFCTEFVRNTHGRFCGKLGAEAVYCIGVKYRDMAVIVKIEDGNYRALYPAVMSALEQMELLKPDEKKALDSFAYSSVLNAHGNVVGEIRPAFKLKFA
jgi:L-asparaginase II